MKTQINADFSQPVIVHSQNMPWQNSPMAGVLRRPLDRVGGEIARATSIVQYAADSHFSDHIHTGGEEFIVLAGTFQDEHGDYPAGSYIRNPPHSHHSPYSQEGCRIFVKLWQFDPDDKTHINLNYHQQPQTIANGVSTVPLYKDKIEHVAVQSWPAHKDIVIAAPKGLEILVLSGDMLVNNETFTTESWLRLPCHSALTAKSGPQGVTFWIKQHHLNQVDAQIKRVHAAMS